jgi:hypothetical protein
MVVIGVDAHKRSHTFVAVDDVGRKVSERTLAATTEGHLEACIGQRSGRSDGSPLRTAGT